MGEKINFSVSLGLYDDDPIDRVILDWLDSMPVRNEDGGKRVRTARRGLNREVRQAIYAYAKKQVLAQAKNAPSRPRKTVDQGRATERAPGDRGSGAMQGAGSGGAGQQNSVRGSPDRLASAPKTDFKSASDDGLRSPSPGLTPGGGDAAKSTGGSPGGGGQHGLGGRGPVVF